MNAMRKMKLLAWCVSLWLGLSPALVLAEDIDIFRGTAAGAAANPNVLIVLDNTSNWARQSQQWPGGAQQGQSEANAIKTVVASLGGNVNLGLMEFVTGGNANDDGGFMRFAVKPMTDANKTAFSSKLTTIYGNVTGTNEKRNSNTSYGNLLYDVYNYYAGAAVSNDGRNASRSLNPPNPDADTTAYASTYSAFQAPLSSDNSCARNYQIFIGNPNASGPASDSNDNTAALTALGCDATEIALPTIGSVPTTATTTLGNTAVCYAAATAAQVAYGYGADPNDPTLSRLYAATSPVATATEYQTQCASYTQGCSIGAAATTTNPMACATGTSSYHVIATGTTTSSSGPTAQNPANTNATSQTCYATQAAASAGVAAGDHAGLTCPVSTMVQTTVGSTTTQTTTTHSCTWALGAVASSCSGAAVQSNPGTTASCYASSANATTAVVTNGTDHGGMSCPAGYNCAYTLGAQGSACAGTPAATSSSTSSCTAAAPSLSSPATSSSVATAATLTCPAGYNCNYTADTPVSCGGSTTSSGTTTSYYASAPTVTSPATSSSLATSPSLSCPSGFSCTYAVGSPAATLGATATADSSTCYASAPFTNGTSATTSPVTTKTALNCPANSTCTYTSSQNDNNVKDGNGNSCTTSTRTYHITQTVATTQYAVTQTAPAGNKYTVHQTPVANYSYAITQTATPASPSKYVVIQTDTPTVSTTSTTTTTTDLGQTSACYASPPASTTDYADQCSAAGTSCTYNTNPATTTNHCATGSSQYLVQAQNLSYSNGPTGTTFMDTNNLNADQWARCLYQKGVPVGGGGNQNVTTYTIDVYNKQPNTMQTSLLLNMAKYGGGKYFAATNEAAIATALSQIMIEIQSVNSTFASAALPVSATNRSLNDNQVFIPMFRPDPDAKPRWFGNVKRYQVILDAAGNPQTGDAAGALAINNNTDFVQDCAKSWWTSDSGSYWVNYPINPTPFSICSTSALNGFSDAPDGPHVEKGAVAEVLRKGNNPTATDTAPTWAVNRTVYTASGTALQPFNVANTGLSATLVNWVLGQDTEAESNAGASTSTRASIHGDVVHSRPLPVNYCTTANCANTVIYYGANDGNLRAVEANTGKEKWAFIAPEFNSALDRLRSQTPAISYSGNALAGSTPRDYFMDGSFGIYQNADNSKIWIYSSMRRGGRMIYGFDVTDPNNPTIKWKFGCPNLGDDTGCTSGASAIGQTWSAPKVAFIRGYSTSTPVVIVGGGYDACEDADSATPSCGSEKGSIVYVLNADTGAVVASFPTLRAVAADVSFLDIDGDGLLDYAYAADTGGNLYRVNFSTWDSASGTSVALDTGHWTITRVAYSSGAGRKFLFAPAVYGGKGIVYLALGSGDREHPLESNYPFTTPINNRFYVYRECLPPSPNASSLSGGDSLDDTTKMNQSSATSPAPCAATATLATNCSANKGWFIDLNHGTGEQVVTSAVITGGTVIYSTNRATPATAGTCTTKFGDTQGYRQDLFKGSGAIATSNGASCGGVVSVKFGIGLPPSPILATVQINNKPVSVIFGAAPKDGSHGSPLSPAPDTPTIKVTRKRSYTIIKGDN